MTAPTDKPRRRVVRYQPSLISYLDILGFKGLVAEKEAGEISRILRIVKEIVTPGRRVSDLLNFRVQHFSDLAVRVLPVTRSEGAGDMFFELLSLVHVQKSLTENGIFVRGGITFGDIVRSWGLLYGPGLIRAYDLEQKAVYPRILVDDDLLTALRRKRILRHPDHDYKTEMEYIRKLIRKDSDGNYFVDYLRAIESEFDYPEAGYPTFLDAHRGHIVAGLDKFRLNKHILAKYKWLKAYHNSTVDKRFSTSLSRKFVI